MVDGNYRHVRDILWDRIRTYEQLMDERWVRLRSVDDIRAWLRSLTEAELRRVLPLRVCDVVPVPPGWGPGVCRSS